MLLFFPASFLIHCVCKTPIGNSICTVFLLQSIRKSVLDEDAPMGKHLARGRDLLVHVTALPHPLRGTTASKCTCPTRPQLGDRAKTCLELNARGGGGGEKM